MNEFHGQGVEKGNGFEFSGQFENGKRKTGTLKWEDGGHQFTYIGGFDQNGKFTGKGTVSSIQASSRTPMENTKAILKTEIKKVSASSISRARSDMKVTTKATLKTEEALSSTVTAPSLSAASF